MINKTFIDELIECDIGFDATYGAPLSKSGKPQSVTMKLDHKYELVVELATLNRDKKSVVPIFSNRSRLFIAYLVEYSLLDKYLVELTTINLFDNIDKQIEHLQIFIDNFVSPLVFKEIKVKQPPTKYLLPTDGDSPLKGQ